jgi:hypothetical protein
MGGLAFAVLLSLMGWAVFHAAEVAVGVRFF